MAAEHFVLVDLTLAAPTDDFAVLLRRLFFRLLRPGHDQCLQTFQPRSIKHRCHRGNQAVELTVAIVLHRFEDLFGKHVFIDRCRPGEDTGVRACLMKDLD
ncbi:hypothetical protein FQZ97_911280 [compost metagenome]